MQERDKTETYLGFCVRAGKAVFGLDRTERLKAAPDLMLADSGLSERSMRRSARLANNFGCPMYICEEGLLGELLHRPSCKLVAVTEKNLAAAIITEIENSDKFRLSGKAGIGGNI